MSKKSVLDTELTNTMFSKQFEDFDCRELNTNDRLFMDNGRCGQRPRNHSVFDQLAGYENLNTNTFHLEPEKKNTYHNYPVLQENGEFCSMNHQIFMNHTKRKLPVQIERMDVDTSVDHLIPDAKPMFLRWNRCN